MESIEELSLNCNYKDNSVLCFNQIFEKFDEEITQFYNEIENFYDYKTEYEINMLKEKKDAANFFQARIDEEFSNNADLTK